MTSYGYTQFNKELSVRGRKNEPNPLPRETSVFMRKAVAALAEEGVDIKSIAKSIHLPVSEVRALTFSFSAVSGVPTESTSTLPSNPSSSVLRLVK